MHRSRILEGHTRINAFLEVVVDFGGEQVTWEVQRMGDLILGEEGRRWVNSGEMGFTRCLDGLLSGIALPEGFSQDPRGVWANARYGRRLSDNTTPPMAVLRYRALSASMVLAENEAPRDLMRETSPMAEMCAGERAQFYYLDQTLEDIWDNMPEDFDVLTFARQNGLLPYEAACLVAPIGLVPVPDEHTAQDAFLRQQYHDLFFADHIPSAYGLL